MLRSMRILLLSSLVLLPVLASAATSETDAEKQAKARLLAEAISACDKGAAVPLDPGAKAPPVQFNELFPADFDMKNLKLLQGQCQAAWIGAPKQARLELQWLRVTVALNQPGSEWLIPQVRRLAGSGSAEAQYLLFQIFMNHRRHGEGSMFPIDRAAAMVALTMAAEQGHMSALQDLVWQYRSGPLLRRDLKRAVQMARRLESAPPQGETMTGYETEMRASMPMVIAALTLNDDGFSPREQRIAFRTVETESKAGTSENSTSALTYIKALRFGRGAARDVVKARQLLETRVESDKYAVPMLADMLAKGEGGPADVKRAFSMLRDEKMSYVGDATTVLASLLLDGKVIGRQPQEAIQLLARSWNLEDHIRLADLLLDYQPRITNVERILSELTAGADVGEPGAAMALARLKLSGNSQFTDIAGGRALLKPLADAGDREALWLYASSQYANLDSSSSRPYRLEDGLSDDQLKRLLDEGISRKEASAFLLSAKLLRRGVLYPQDDQAATNMLISAANLGNVEAMVLLGQAYAKGIGTAENPRERLKAWRLAAGLGSLEAKKNLADAFTFDTFKKLMTLDEGITGRLVLHINGVDRRLGGLGIAEDTMAQAMLGTMFSFGSRAMEAGPAAVAEAVMNAFREAPAGLEEKTLVGIGKALPDELRVAIETKLKRDGFYNGQPDGYLGPEVRKALTDWVYAKGPVNIAVAETETATPEEGNTAKSEALVAADILGRVRDQAFKAATAAKTDRQKLTSLSQLNALARYGDLAPRWALVRNYHQARVVRKVVTAAEITRYALDILVTKPEGMDKAEFEFIFNTTKIYEDKQIRVFGDTVLAVIRDDKRLQDPLTLGGVMQHFIFAPGACDAILDAAKKARIKGLGSDGCADDVRTALIEFARDRGPAGVDAAARKAAALEIKSMDEEAAE